MPGQIGVPPEIEMAIGPLQPAASDSDFELHEAAVAWGLVEPIVIDSEDDIRSRRRWGDRLQPFRHQIDNLFLFCRRLPVTLIADEVGLGKTISAGLVLAELMERRRVRRTLVLAPKVLGPQWQEELATKFDIAARAASGGEFDELLGTEVPVVITTYETIRSRPEALRGGAFDMLILDEAHKLRNLYPGDPPRMAQTVRQCLAERLVKFVVMLTATPMQNRLWDLYSLVDCLAAARGLRNPFGPPALFESTYCKDQSGRTLRPEAAARLRTVLREYLCRTRKADAQLVFPARHVQLAAAPPSAAERELLGLIEPLIEELPALGAISLLKACASSPAAVAAQLEHMAERRPHWAAAVARAKQLAADASASSKVTQLLRLVERLRSERPADWRVLVFTERLETQALVLRELARRGIECGAIRGGQPALNQDAIAGLRSDPPRHHVVVSTDSGAEGVNLQAANVLVNLDLPWNPMKLEQRIGRVQRLGSSHASVEIVNLVLQGTFDEQVLALLMTKLETVAQSIGDIESILDSLEDEDGEGFEERVLDLVRRSMQGKDVQAALATELASIEEAQRRMREEGELVDRTLGDLRHLHRSGTRPPDLARSVPRLALPDFVAAALAREGAEVRPLDGQRIAVASGSRTRVYALEPTAQGEVAMFPGTQEFDRLVARWSDTASMQLRRVRAATSPDDAARRWLASIAGAELAALRPLEAQGRFDGELTVLASAANAFDRYEKIIRCPSPPLRALEDVVQPPIEVAESAVDHGFGHERFGESVRELVVRGVGRDPDVTAFTRFYQARGDEEAARPEAMQPGRIRDEHRASVRAEVVSLRGRLCEQRRLAVTARLGGVAYEVELLLDAARGTVRHEGPMAACARSGQRVPEPWLARSACGGEPVLKHLLEPCAATGDLVLPEQLVVSEVSGKRVRADQTRTATSNGRRGHTSELVADAVDGAILLPEEAGQSSVSGRWTRRERLVASARDPSRRGLPDEAVTCAVTGQTVLRDEVGRSELSARYALLEHIATSQETGRTGIADEIAICPWTGRRVLLDELGACALTGVRVVRSALDGKGILVEARELLARQAGESLPGVVERLQHLDASRFRRAEQAIGTRSTRTKAAVALLRLRGILGFGTRYVVVVVADAAGPATAQDGCWISRNLTGREVADGG